MDSQEQLAFEYYQRKPLQDLLVHYLQKLPNMTQAEVEELLNRMTPKY